MNVIGKYIYGIINSKGEEYFGRRGHPAAQKRVCISHNFFVQQSVPTIDTCEGVYTIPYQDISAVVSDSEIVDYTHMLKSTLARLLVRHQEVIERIMSLEHTVIPMRLGTFALDENEVRHILAKGYPIIKDIFNKTKDKIEVDVVATWSDFTSVLKEVGEDEEIKEFKEKLLSNSKGITVDDQMKVGVVVKKALEEKRERYAEQIQNVLKAVSCDLKVHELMDDKMVVNIAFLINKHEQKDFDRKIEALNAKFSEKLNFRCVGPLPPYSFYTLEVQKMQFEEIDWARKRLGLNNTATEEEIKKAHQTKAFSSHPDKNPNMPGIERKFDEVTKAYKVLLDYCQDKSCSFKEEDFKNNSLIVNVRG